MENKKYPPTREDCNTGSIQDHLYQIPLELAQGGYLPETHKSEAMATNIEDRFHKDHTYKYRSTGECIRDRNTIDQWIQSRLWIPDGFPSSSSTEKEQGQWYSQIDKSPVQWIVFSLGPKFNEEQILENLQNRYPVPKESWYDPEQKKGFIVRLRLKNGQEIGTFEGY
ncbi:hypothetical protein GF406_19755 [candidate division KSB1 bacterium]|nr:hypothetical protein [candidate division KSB1 bacterium]